jgi:peroxiredoxin
MSGPVQPAGNLQPADDGGARHLVAGLALPDIELASTQGGLVNLRRRGGLSILYVYPWTGRPGLADPPGWDHIPGAHGSTPESEGFRDLHARFRRLDAEIFGISAQGTEHQRELSERLGLPFAVLSDADYRFQAALALPTFATGGVRYLRRLTLVVRDGAIRHAFYPVHPPGPHAGEVLAWLQQAAGTERGA